MKSHVSREENKTFFIRVWKPLPSRRVLKNNEEKLERENPKRTISVSGGLELLQMVSEPDTEQCANEEAKPRKGWTQSDVPARTVGPRRGVDCENPHRLGRRTKHSL